jgi:trigger factor
MATIHVEPSDNQQDILTIEIEKADYQLDLEKELKTIRKKSSIKGFRPGSAPLNYVKKLYGRDTLVRVITSKMDEELKSFLEENEKNYILEPILRSDSEMPFEDPNAEKFVIKFDFGKKPVVELKGLPDELKIVRLMPEIEDSEITAEIDRLRQTFGILTYPEKDIQEEDLLNIWIREMDEAGENILEKGFEETIKISPQDIKHEELKATLLKSAVGDTIRFDYRNLSEKEEDYIKRYILKAEDDSEINYHFEGLIEEVSRRELADFNPDFYKQVLGEDIAIEDEDDFHRQLKQRMQDYSAAEYNKFVVNEFKKQILVLNPLEFPEEFFKNYIVSKSEEVLTDEDVEHSLIHLKEDLHWNLLLNEILKAWDVKIEEEDINNQFRQMIRQYMGGQYLPEVEENFVTRSWQNEEMVKEASNRVLSNKFVRALLEKVPMEVELMPKEAFKAKLEELEEAEKAAEHNHDHHHAHDHSHDAEHDHASEDDHSGTPSEDIEK